MARLLNSLRQFVGLGQSSSPAIPTSRFGRSIDTDFSFFREGDRVIVHGKNPLLTKPLRRGQKSDVRRGKLQHDQIIGRRVRDRVQAQKGPDYRLTLPTLDEYVALTPRLVTPIYAADASLIVSLLDIHVAQPGDGDTTHQPLEILESGTGHGSLTLQLSRAIQAANSLPPPIPAASQVKHLERRPIRPDETETNSSPQTPIGTDKEVDPVQQTWDTWRAERKAIIHTVDVSPKFSAHAETIVRGFRRGIYAGNVDFYVGPAENWIAEQIRRRTPIPSTFSLTKLHQTPEPFLTHAILDMPSANLRIPYVTPILKRDGILAVFMPSVTQIGECVDLIRKQNLPLVLEKAVELGSGISSGRLWDVRFAVKKSRADPSSWTKSDETVVDTEPESETETGAATEESSVSSSGEETLIEQTETEAQAKEPESALVCRPKVGTRIVGGGFVGIWRRVEDFPNTQS
ncbi:S-adenosyl-L-methionine-dependent methyltransferase [Aspergillus cavernicola]|uniref:tRNA (adenine(58)-N(1))-methyltransferase catalytic subunit TRM61 n=1 Tax=Aspergillus cavernicola TaxID=176166 RepID=A0ABR4HXJ0_9EURO